MKVTVELRYGSAGDDQCYKGDIQENINILNELLERDLNVHQLTSVHDTISILMGIQKELPRTPRIR